MTSDASPPAWRGLGATRPTPPPRGLSPASVRTRVVGGQPHTPDPVDRAGIHRHPRRRAAQERGQVGVLTKLAPVPGHHDAEPLGLHTSWSKPPTWAPSLFASAGMDAARIRRPGRRIVRPFTTSSSARPRRTVAHPPRTPRATSGRAALPALAGRRAEPRPVLRRRNGRRARERRLRARRPSAQDRRIQDRPWHTRIVAPNRMVLPFEGMGVEAIWRSELPQPANPHRPFADCRSPRSPIQEERAQGDRHKGDRSQRQPQVATVSREDMITARPPA